MGRRKNGYIEELKVSICNEHFVLKPFLMSMTFKTSQMVFNTRKNAQLGVDETNYLHSQLDNKDHTWETLPLETTLSKGL